MHKLLAATAILLAASLSATAQSAPPPDALKELAPTGKLRAAINFGNRVLAQKGAAGEAKGITPDLARELGRRLGVPVELVPFEAAGKVAEAAKVGVWDVAFLAIEPSRATTIEFTAPYVQIEATYMVRKESPLKEIADVDRAGVRIATGRGSGYTPTLKRIIKHATVVEASAGGGRAPIELFVNEKLEVSAGVREALEAYAKTNPDMRVMAGRFMAIEQAMATPKGHAAGARYVAAFVESVKASGFVADALKRSGQTAMVAPPAR